jgi:hypothetical protein
LTTTGRNAKRHSGQSHYCEVFNIVHRRSINIVGGAHQALSLTDLKPVFLGALATQRLSHSPQSSTGVVIITTSLPAHASLAPVCEIEANQLLRSSSSSTLTVGMSGFGIEKPVIYKNQSPDTAPAQLKGVEDD